MKYKFSLEKRRKDGVLIEENVPIRINVNHNSKRITLSTGFRTDKRAWDESGEVIKKGFLNKQREAYNVINAVLNEQKIFLDKYKILYQLESQAIDLERIKVEFAQKFERRINQATHKDEGTKTFFDLFTDFTTERGKQNDWSTATFGKFTTLKTHLEKFDTELNFEALSEDKLLDIVDYLREEVDMKNNTIKKQLGYLKWYLNWAVDKGHTTNLAYKKFKPKLKTAERQVVYLNGDELNKIREYEIPESKKSLDRIRDVFLFCCYTSIRYSDVYALKRSEINDGRINIITQKTTDKLRIKLNNKALDIIEKYKNIPFKGGKALPVISNQRTNDYIKDLCKLAGIDTPVTQVYFKGNIRHEHTSPKYTLVGTHTARRTFICNALINGMPVHAVMKITGHSDYKAMQPYIDIVNKEVDRMVDKFIDF